MSGPDRAALAAILSRPRLARLLDALDGDGEETRIVGGAVRNALLGRTVDEVDLATTAPPTVTTARARRAGLNPVPTGAAHGTITVVVGNEPFEVTTLREDVETDGRHAVVRFGRDFAADARRRDFTVNALSADRSGRVHDVVGGLDDLSARRVRFIGDPDARIAEDYLRILRFFRFSATYADGSIDPDGFAAAIRGRIGLPLLSRERVRAELLKLVAAERAPEVLRLMAESGLLQTLVGGVAEHGRLSRAIASEHAGPDAVLRLGGLLVATEEDADRLGAVLRLSNAEHDRLAGLAAASEGLRSIGAPVDEADLRRLAARLGAERVGDAVAILAGEPRPCLTEAAQDLARRYAAGTERAPVFPLSGADFVRAGVPAGPEIGRRLAAARAAWLAVGCPAEWTFTPA